MLHILYLKNITRAIFIGFTRTLLCSLSSVHQLISLSEDIHWNTLLDMVKRGINLNTRTSFDPVMKKNAPILCHDLLLSAILLSDLSYSVHRADTIIVFYFVNYPFFHVDTYFRHPSKMYCLLYVTTCWTICKWDNPILIHLDLELIALLLWKDYAVLTMPNYLQPIKCHFPF